MKHPAQPGLDVPLYVERVEGEWLTVTWTDSDGVQHRGLVRQSDVEAREPGRRHVPADA